MKGKDSSYNAKQISDLFSGNIKNIYYKEIILLNTAAILVLTSKCKNLKQGIEIAEKNIKDILDQFNLKEIDDLFFAVGSGKISPSKIIVSMFPKKKIIEQNKSTKIIKSELQKKFN